MNKLHYLLIILLAVCACTPKKAPLPTDLPADELQYRLAIDFAHSREDVKAIISQYMPDVTDEQIDAWTADGTLETMYFGDSLRYFRRTARNLFRVDSLANTYYNPKARTAELVEMDSMVIHTALGYTYDLPMRVHYALRVRANAVPAGETIRCWLPYPRRDLYEVKMLSTMPSEYLMPDSSAVHSTVYMEQVAVADEETVFEETFEYCSYIRDWTNSTSAEMLRPEDCLGEMPPHIVFSDRLRHLADSLTAGLTTDYDKALAIFKWIDDSFPWAGSREYSTIPCIPEYVLDAKHGDCGQVSLLFITLCRIVGIPAHFQSGFYMQPGDDGMHDWAEVYLTYPRQSEPTWMPVDQSFGLQHYAAAACLDRRANAEYSDVLNVYLGHLEPWRMIVNQDISAPLYPAKQFPRSETVDFQRGEVEWKGGNLYFPEWDYEMEIEYLQ